MRVGLIIIATADEFGIEVEDLLGPRKTKQIATARAVALYVARHLTSASYPDLGRIVNRDHTTVFALVRTAARLRARDPAVATVVDRLLDRLGRPRPVRLSEPASSPMAACSGFVAEGRCA